jgi:hypothetical protein
MSPPLRTLLACTLAATSFAALSAPAHAASAYDACTAFITSLPATIGTQGIWCLNKDLNTAMASGNAITITANNVTLDCNGYKLGGLLAGAGTATVGVYANGRSNLGVRDCNIRGFFVGVSLEGSSGSGHRIERNRFEANTGAGANVVGDGAMVRDNLVVDTGGTLNTLPFNSGVIVSGRVDVLDNQIVAVDGTNSMFGQAVGITVANAAGSAIHHNRVSGLVIPEAGQAIGLNIISGTQLDVRENTFANDVEGPSVSCVTSGQMLKGNALMMGEVIGPCTDALGNYGYGFPL